MRQRVFRFLAGLLAALFLWAILTGIVQLSQLSLSMSISVLATTILFAAYAVLGNGPVEWLLVKIGFLDRIINEEDGNDIDADGT